MLFSVTVFSFLTCTDYIQSCILLLFFFLYLQSPRHSLEPFISLLSLTLPPRPCLELVFRWIWSALSNNHWIVSYNKHLDYYYCCFLTWNPSVFTLHFFLSRGSVFFPLILFFNHTLLTWRTTHKIGLTYQNNYHHLVLCANELVSENGLLARIVQIFDILSVWCPLVAL